MQLKKGFGAAVRPGWSLRAAAVEFLVNKWERDRFSLRPSIFGARQEETVHGWSL